LTAHGSRLTALRVPIATGYAFHWNNPIANALSFAYDALIEEIYG
jgi:hypothetical protein